MLGNTELYLGLVHATDGVEGTSSALRQRSIMLGGVGVATECGCGRRKPEVLSELMRIHRMVSQPFAALRCLRC